MLLHIVFVLKINQASFYLLLYVRFLLSTECNVNMASFFYSRYIANYYFTFHKNNEIYLNIDASLGKW